MHTHQRDLEFSEFVASQRARLVKTALLLTGGRYAESEDLVQTALTRLYARWARVSRVDDPLGYSLRTLTNVFLDERKRAFRRREVVTDEQADRPGAGDAMADRDVRSEVMTALLELAPRQRAVVVLRHYLGYDVAAVARLLAIADGTVKSQNAKALTRLRELLGDEIEARS